MRKLFIIIMLLTLSTTASWGQAGENSYFMSKAIQERSAGNDLTALNYAMQEISASPENVDAYIFVSTIYSDYKIYGEALKELNNGLQNIPSKNKVAIVKIHIAKGDIYYQMGEYEKAIEELNAAQKLNSKEYEIYYERFFSHMELHNYDAALKDIDTYIANKDKSAVMYIIRSYCCKEKGDYDVALQTIDMLLASDTLDNEQRGRLYEMQAEIYRKTGNYYESIRSTIKFHQFSPYNAYIVTNVPQEYIDEAVEFYKQYCDSLTEEQQNYYIYILGELHFKAELYSKAIEYYTQSEDNETSQIRIANCCIKASADYYPLGMENIEKCLEKDSTVAESLYIKALLFMNMNEYDKALNILDNIIESYYSEDMLYASRGAIYYILGQYELAIQDYSYALGCSSDATYYIYRAMVYRQMGNEERATEDMSAAIRIYQESDKNSLQCALAYAANGEQDAALSILDTYIKERDAQNSRYSYQEYIFIASIYNMMGDKQQAYDALYKAVQIVPSRDFYEWKSPIIGTLTNSPEFDQMFNTQE